ncbi:MAG TPA: hypothetical protein PLZ08_03540 [Bacillota bacterium]|nr:hypothetical protein [Bacillota bacterium]HOL09189.1 hypothetical protein [Bacillota bacterium]HPO97013.1 hypothetical protein [Bacillota bacterium]
MSKRAGVGVNRYIDLGGRFGVSLLLRGSILIGQTGWNRGKLSSLSGVGFFFYVLFQQLRIFLLGNQSNFMNGAFL